MNRRWLGLFALPLLMVSCYALWAFDHPWRGQWNWTVDFVTGSTVLTGPLIGAMAAWLAMTHRRYRPLTDSTVNDWASVPRLAGELWLTGTLVYALVAAVALSITALSPHGGPYQWWVLLIGPLVLRVCTLTGAVAGSLAPFRITSVFVGAGIFLAGAFGPSPVVDLLRHGPGLASLAGIEFDPGVWTGQALGLLGLIVIGVAAGAALGHGRSKWIATTGIVGIAVTGLGLGLNARGDRFQTSTESANACMGVAPEVCLADSNRIKLDQASAQMHAGAQRMRRLGLIVPPRYEELLVSHRVPPTVGMITSLPDGPRSDTSWVWNNLLTPAACDFWTDARRPPPGRVMESQALLEAWITQGSAATDSAWSEQARDWLRHSDSTASRAWARATFSALTHCRADQVRLPWKSA